MTTRLLTALALCAGLASCTTRNEINPAAELPYDLRGSIVGRITSGATGQPLAGAQVSALAAGGPVSTTSGADGTYELDGLPAGVTYTVRFEAAGCVRRTAAVALAASAGNVGLLHPAATADAVLWRGDATLAGTVRFAGQPAQGVTLSVDLRASGLDLVATATTGADGSYALTGLPGAPGGWQLQVALAPWDADADGLADIQPRSVYAITYPASTTALDLSYSAGSGGVPGFTLTGSDLGGGTHAADAPLHLSFSDPVDADASTFTLQDQTSYAYRAVPVTVALEPSGLGVAISAVGGTPLASGHPYALSVRAVAVSGAVYTGSFWFTAAAGGGVMPPVTGLATTPARVDYNTSGVTLAWDEVAGASSYAVYARDTHLNPSWVQVGTVGSAPAPALAISLPATFDAYSADDVQSPFAFGTAVELAVVAVGVTGATGDLSAATPLRLADTVAPTAIGATQLGSAVNPGAAEATLTLTVSFDEYMDAAAVPTIDLPAPGMSATFQLDAGLRKGTFTVTVPPATWGWGDFLVYGAKDSSGNLMVPFAGRLAQQTELVANGGFEAGVLNGWTVDTSGSIPAPAATQAQASQGSWSARLGSLGAQTSAGSTSVSQDLVVPAGSSELVARVAYQVTGSTGYNYDSYACTLAVVPGGTSATLFYSYGGYAATGRWVTPPELHLYGWGGKTVRLLCTVTEGSSSGTTGLYLDGLSVIAIE